MDESIGQVPATWCVAVAYEKPMNPFRTWFKPAPTESLQALLAEVQSTLEGERDFKITDEARSPS